MKNTVTKTLTATGLTLAMLAATPTFAEPGKGPRHHGPGNMIEHIAKKLDLNDEQQAEIKALFEQSRGAGEADRERLQALHKSLHSADTFNAAEVKAAADEIGEITSRMTYRRAETRYKVSQVLTGEQRLEMRAMMEKRKGRMRQAGKHRMDRPGFDEG